MPQDSHSDFDFDFDIGFGIAEVDLSSDEVALQPADAQSNVEDADTSGDNPDSNPAANPIETPTKNSTETPADTRPTSERIAELFDEMAPRRRVLIALLEYLREPRIADSLEGEVERLQTHDYSIYNSSDYAALLERAGAICKTDQDGTPLNRDEEQQPEIVVIDDIEYLKPAPWRQVWWLITPEGAEYLQTDKPLERLVALFEDEAVYKKIFKRILAFCDVEGGRAITQINEIADHDPLLKEPRRFALHFVKKLEECDGLVWEGAWVTTENGRHALEYLADVADDNPAQPVQPSSESGE